jgi:formate-dependent nitrite reductase membrane component NrfD
MNLFVADPHWGWWIILYFFFGGLAAGAYFMATLIDLVGHEGDRELARMGYWIAFPLICLCGLFLTVDLEQPARFWHMLFESEVVDEAFRQGWPWTAASWRELAHAPLMKYWSPMSVGSWALTVFGLCSGLSFLGSLWDSGRLYRWLRFGVIGRVLQFVGCLVGFFVAAYTGSLLTATNQPIWSDTDWIAPLFLTSAASTGIAFLMVLVHFRGGVSAGAMHRLERADLWALGLELIVLTAFLASLGPFLWPLLATGAGKLLIGGALILGLLVPLALHLRLGIDNPRSALAASLFALLGGFLLRYAVVSTAPELLSRGPAHVAGFSPEDGRVPGGGIGADPGNRPPHLHPRSKVFQDE